MTSDIEKVDCISKSQFDMSLHSDLSPGRLLTISICFKNKYNIQWIVQSSARVVLLLTIYSEFPNFGNSSWEKSSLNLEFY